MYVVIKYIIKNWNDIYSQNEWYAMWWKIWEVLQTIIAMIIKYAKGQNDEDVVGVVLGMEGR